MNLFFEDDIIFTVILMRSAFADFELTFLGLAFLPPLFVLCLKDPVYLEKYRQIRNKFFALIFNGRDLFISPVFSRSQIVFIYTGPC